MRGYWLVTNIVLML